MRYILIGLCSFFLIFNSSLWAKSNTATIQVKGNVPVGAVIGKHKVTLKKGFIFEKKSATHAVARMRGGRGGITGDFDCTCNGEEGGCSVVTTPNSATCVSSGCNSCYMIITIPGKAGSVLHQ